MLTSQLFVSDALSEAKNLTNQDDAWPVSNPKRKEWDEILHFVQNDKREEGTPAPTRRNYQD